MNKGVGGMNELISIFFITPSKGTAPPIETKKRTIWADVYLAGIKTQASMMSVGKKTEHTAEVWKESYKNETHVEYNGIKYKIEAVLPGRDKYRIKLLLSRG